MPLRVSLQIDGDSSGAVKAAQDASVALGDVGKHADAANGSLDRLKNSSASAGAANDNAAASAGAFAQKIGELVGKIQGVGGNFSKAAQGAAGFANDIGALVRSAGGFSIVTAGAGLAVSAASTFYDIINRGSQDAAKRLTDQAALVGTVRDAYRDAGTAAGRFLDETKKVTLFLIEQKQAGLKDDLVKAARGVVSGINFDSTIAAITNQNNLGVGGIDGSTNDAEVRAFQKLQSAVVDFNASIASGVPDLDRFKNSLVDIGKGDSAAAKVATDRIEKIKADTDAVLKQVRDGQAAINKIKGIDTKDDDARLGTQIGEFDRFTKSIDRQSAAMSAEAQTAGLSAGAVAKLRTEFILTEAANQAGAGAAEKYASKIQEVATRAGEAAQKLALARLQSETAFNRDQLGRSAIDASVADQLRGAFGNKADLNGYEADLVRTNETLKELKSTTQDVGSGAFRDFRTEIQNGTNAWDAFGKAGVNALNRIIDKLADKALDKFISGGISSLANAFGIGTGTVANGGIVLGGPGGPGTFAAAGGGTFGPGWGVVGEEGAEIIKVHAGGVTVYPHQVSRPYLPGFAEGGSLSPFGLISALSSSGQNTPQAAAQSAQQLNHHITAEVVVKVDKNGELQAYVKNTTVQTVLDYGTSPTFSAHVADAVREGQSRRLI